jgi:glutathione synthase/RimK-type ligase-like ATP-grasp enzyme
LMLLILTSERDFAVDFLIVELARRRLPYFRLNAEDIAAANFEYSLDDSGISKEISVGPRTLTLSDVTAVWYRRGVRPAFANSALSPQEQHFVAGELRHLVMALVLNCDAAWVNPIEKVSIAEHKLYQLETARSAGFRVPRTFVSRDAQKLREFANSNRAGTICKPIYHGFFFDGASRFSAYTRRVQPGEIDRESTSVCPVLLQEEIPRSADLRVTMIGAACFVTEIESDDDIVDWRDPKLNIRYAVSNIADEAIDKCRAILNRLDLLYGAFDFIRTPDGEVVFLEVNPTGEWAWLEDRLGFPMRDAFIQLFFGG